MAWLHKEQKARGAYWRLRVSVDGKTQRVALGYDQDQKALDKLKYLAGKLESLRAVGEAPDPNLQATLDRELSEELLAKFADVGLVQELAPSLQEFLRRFIDAKQTDVAPDTIRKLTNTAKRFVEFFGDVRLSSITPGSAHDYVLHRKSQGMAESSVAAEVKHGRQFFKYAVRKRYLLDNPFAEEKVAQQVDTLRRRILEADLLEDMLAAAPCVDWRVFLALLRWLGCRKSEALQVKWSDIDWDRGRVRVPSSKTARYGKASRVVPLFPELRPHLEEARTAAGAASVYVVNTIVRDSERSSTGSKNLDGPLQKIIVRAGHEPWPKLFQNLRVTRENELVRRHPAHVVQQWIGHTAEVANKHYLTVTDEDFRRAVGCSSGQIVGGNPLRRAAPDDRQKRKTPVLQGSAASRVHTQQAQMLPLGLEPRTH